VILHICLHLRSEKPSRKRLSLGPNTAYNGTCEEERVHGRGLCSSRIHQTAQPA